MYVHVERLWYLWKNSTHKWTYNNNNKQSRNSTLRRTERNTRPTSSLGRIKVATVQIVRDSSFRYECYECRGRCCCCPTLLRSMCITQPIRWILWNIFFFVFVLKCFFLLSLSLLYVCIVHCLSIVFASHFVCFFSRSSIYVSPFFVCFLRSLLLAIFLTFFQFHFNKTTQYENSLVLRRSLRQERMLIYLHRL